MSDQHAKKDCPRLQGKEAGTSKGKEKAMHMVQCLTHIDSPKYLAVEVLHDEEQHECCVSALMWQPTFGPHELHRMHGTINGQRVCILVDDGATHNFLNYKLIKKLKLTEVPSAHKYVVEQMTGNDKEVWNTVVQGVELKVQENMMTLDFQVMNMARVDVVLGREWLHSLGSSLNCSYEHNSLSFISNDIHVLLLGEINIPPTPLICNSKLSYLQKAILIEEIFFCYCLSPKFDSQKQDTKSVNEQCAFNSFSVEQSVLDIELLSSSTKENLDNLLKEYGDVFR